MGVRLHVHAASLVGADSEKFRAVGETEVLLFYIYRVLFHADRAVGVPDCLLYLAAFLDFSIFSNPFVAVQSFYRKKIQPLMIPYV